MGYQDQKDFSVLKGETLTSVVGADAGSEGIVFTCASGNRFKLFHDQDCCESVRINDIIGDVNDLIGRPLILVEVSTNSKDYPSDIPKPANDYGEESFTWTFYRLGTVLGHVDIRWIGESNGYYSEGVDFEQLTGNGYTAQEY